HVGHEPRFVPELPGAPQIGRELREEVVQPVQVLFEIWRQLKQDRPELRAQFARRLEEVAQRVVHVAEAGDVRDALGCLENEGEPSRRGGVPAGHRFRVRHAIERVVDLHRGEPLGVILEHLGLGHLGRIERPLPLGEVVAGGADPEVHATHTVLTFTNSRRPYSDSSRPYPERFTPPNGSRGSDLTSPFTNTLPASISRATRSPRCVSRVHTAAPRPYDDALAMRIASPSSLARITAATGPNVSWSNTGIPASTATS